MRMSPLSTVASQVRTVQPLRLLPSNNATRVLLEHSPAFLDLQAVQEVVESANAITRVQNTWNVFIKPLTVTSIVKSFQPASPLGAMGCVLG